MGREGHWEVGMGKWWQDKAEAQRQVLAFFHIYNVSYEALGTRVWQCQLSYLVLEFYS
jgi:hypothetical protein